MYSKIFVILSFLAFLIGQNKDEQPDAKNVMSVMEKVADWQLENPTDKALWVWDYGAFYSGLSSFYKVNKDPKYLKAMFEVGETYKWGIRPRPWDANVLAIGHMYLDMYEISGDKAILHDIEFCLNAHFDRHPKQPDVTFMNNKYWWSWWSWCDALFMAPPTFAKYAEVTGETKYLDKMDELWEITHNYLFDTTENLYYRDDRFFEKESKNRKKVFWSRGNGWVLGGLVKVMEAMPKDYKNRDFYEETFKKMCAAVKNSQHKKGYWTASMLDQKDFEGIESSGTAFFCYAIAWGINKGYLDEKAYKLTALKAWDVLVKCVHPTGKVGYVQRVGYGPDSVSYDDSEEYGAGAFLLAGSEIYKMVAK
ncbi:glycoside hydrolase family 88 protein [Tamlana fucoidanivorans]|uniref:Glycoside hydrolase family 88 protein n=1 Tax=Allotamlana fucoidanivorans TaxID=2583814 RepID=A0A5C4SP05_9FLAO|nr:glycoside hydrolase family 88 protein [Tamlana fucoidanivorans]TNJ45848.1 glycoside hydrolase family 88 protein [Tamlana fucoidanivorans]